VVPDPNGKDSQDDITFILSMQDAGDGTMGITNAPFNYPFLTVVRVVARGMEHRTANYPYIGEEINRGPAGHAVFGWFYQNVYSGPKILGVSTDTATDSASAYYSIQGAGANPSRSGYGKRRFDNAEFNGEHITCGQDNAHLCDTWSGNTTFEFHRLQSQMATSADSTSASPGSTVTFNWGASPAVVEGQQMPVTVDTGKWVPDPDSLGGDPNEFPSGGSGGCDTYNPCKRKMLGSGTFIIKAYVNGKRYADSIHVSVPTLKLTANPKSVVAGQPVTFTPSWSDGTAVTAATMWSWTWTPDSTSGSTGGCPYYQVPCQRNVQERGTMTVRVSRGGVIRSAKAHVNVSKCPPTNDAKLDSPDVRAGFMDMMKLSNPDSTPGSGINPADWVNTGYKKEKAVWIFKRPDGSYYTRPAEGLATECQFQADSEPDFPYAPDSLVGLAHTHPSTPGDTVYGACQSRDAKNRPHPVKRYRGDTQGQVGLATDEAAWGGGSAADWATAFKMKNIDQYIMTKGGDVWRLPGGWSDSLRMQDTSGRHKKWRTSSCKWP